MFPGKCAVADSAEGQHHQHPKSCPEPSVSAASKYFFTCRDVSETILTNSVTVIDEWQWLQEFKSWTAKFSFCLWYPICCSICEMKNSQSTSTINNHENLGYLGCLASPCPRCSHPIRTSWPTLGYLFQHLWAIDFHWSSLRNTTWKSESRTWWAMNMGHMAAYGSIWQHDSSNHGSTSNVAYTCVTPFRQTPSPAP